MTSGVHQSQSSDFGFYRTIYGDLREAQGVNHDGEVPSDRLALCL